MPLIDILLPLLRVRLIVTRHHILNSVQIYDALVFLPELTLRRLLIEFDHGFLFELPWVVRAGVEKLLVICHNEGLKSWHFYFLLRLSFLFLFECWFGREDVFAQVIGREGVFQADWLDHIDLVDMLALVDHPAIIKILLFFLFLLRLFLHRRFILSIDLFLRILCYYFLSFWRLFCSLDRSFGGRHIHIRLYRVAIGEILNDIVDPSGDWLHLLIAFPRAKCFAELKVLSILFIIILILLLLLRRPCIILILDLLVEVFDVLVLDHILQVTLLRLLNFKYLLR